MHATKEVLLPAAKRFVLPDQPGKVQVMGAELSPQQFGRAAELSPRRVRQLCDEGKIRYRRLIPNSDRSWIRIPVSELERFLQPA